MADHNLTKELLHEYFEYRDGELYWKVKLSYNTNIGDRAGFLDGRYRSVKIHKKSYGIHRIIFAMHHGHLPKMTDHIDRNTFNNRIENLREVTNQQNQFNTTKNIRNTSGYKNVLFRKDRQKWACRFQINGKHIMRGAFDTPEEANEYAIKLRQELHGVFARS